VCVCEESVNGARDGIWHLGRCSLRNYSISEILRKFLITTDIRDYILTYILLICNNMKNNFKKQLFRLAKSQLKTPSCSILTIELCILTLTI
jgi:hypothetical protein